MLRQGVDDIRQADIDAMSAGRQTLQVLIQQATPLVAASSCAIGHHGTHTRVCLEPFLLDEVLDGFMRRIGVNLQIRGNGAHRRKWLSREIFAAQYGTDGGKDHLVDDRQSAAEFEIECRHIGTVTPTVSASQYKLIAGDSSRFQLHYHDGVVG